MGARCSTVKRRAKSVGDTLLSARLAGGMSLQDVAGKTKISLRFLRALEEDDLSVFPSRVFIFGFAKAYAKAVGLNSTEVVMKLGQDFEKSFVATRSI